MTESREGPQREEAAMALIRTIPSLDDVRSHAELLSRHLADIVVRFMENRCARPTPVPLPPFFGRLGRAGTED